MTIQIRGVLLKQLPQQADRDGLRIDPAGVRFDPSTWLPITSNFDHSLPPVGRGRVHREADGSLVVEGELFSWPSEQAVEDDQVPPFRLAIGVVIPDDVPRPGIAHESDLMSIALTASHQDPTQPPIVIGAAIRKESQMIDKAEIEKRFTHHRPDADAQEKHDWARSAFKEFAEGLAESLPDGREKSLAFTALEESSFWAHAAVARWRK
jgi:hypothetical protein